MRRFFLTSVYLELAKQVFEHMGKKITPGRAAQSLPSPIIDPGLVSSFPVWPHFFIMEIEHGLFLRPFYSRRAVCTCNYSRSTG